jgi:hypothetical protein
MDRAGRKPEPVIPKISQDTLAEMIGTNRSRVSFFMNKFRKLGFIRYNGAPLDVHSSLLKIFARLARPSIEQNTLGWEVFGSASLKSRVLKIRRDDQG